MPKFKVSVSSFPNMVCTIKQKDEATLFQYQLPSRFALIKNNDDYPQFHAIGGLNYLANFSKDFFPQKSTKPIQTSEDKSVVAQISFQNPQLDVWYFHQDRTPITPKDFVRLNRSLIVMTPGTSDAAILAATKWYIVDNSWLAIFVKYVTEGQSGMFFNITDAMQPIEIEAIPVAANPSSFNPGEDKNDKSIASPLSIVAMSGLDDDSDLPFPYCQDPDENKRGYSPLLDGSVSFWTQQQRFHSEDQSTKPTYQRKIALPFPPETIEQKNPATIKDPETRKTEKPELPETTSHQKKVALPFPPETITQTLPTILKDTETSKTEKPESPETTSSKKIQETNCAQATGVFQFLFDYDYENPEQEKQEEEEDPGNTGHIGRHDQTIKQQPFC